MSSSEGESSGVPREPTGAIAGRKDVKRIKHIDPFYEVPEGRLVDVSEPEPDQRAPDIEWVMDYRKLNAVTIKDSFRLPRIDDSLDTLGGAKWFSTLDLQSGYWKVEMEESSKEKTAFICGSGLYQFEWMPFGLCNSPATYERLMERVLAGLQWQVCFVFLDDVIVYGVSFEDQLQRLRLVFGRLRAANLKLSPKKCNLFRREVAYLGHIVSQNGISPDPGKIESIQTWPIPDSVTAVRSFFGPMLLLPSFH